MGDILNYNLILQEKIRKFCIDDDIVKPKVSIIVPAYNVEKYIVKCLESLIKQSLKEIEIIVINDGSTDDTASLAGIFASCDKRVRLINQYNQKQGAARNRGIECARGGSILGLLILMIGLNKIIMKSCII